MRVNEIQRDNSFFSMGEMTKTNTIEVEEYKNNKEQLMSSINDRLGYLRPSKELLEFYRKKLADHENEMFHTKLNDLHDKFANQQRLEFNLIYKNDEINELKKALSDMQIYLFQEQEHVLKLYSENDRLKIKELEDNKKIQHLLTFCGKTEGEIKFFLRNPPNKQMISMKTLPKLNGKIKNNQGIPAITSNKKENNNLNFEIEILQNKLKAIQIQLEEQTQISKELNETFLNDKRIKQEEFDLQRQKDTKKINNLIEQLNKSQELMYAATKDFINLRQECRSKEKQWIHEKDRLLQQLDSCKQKFDVKYHINHPILIPNEFNSENENKLKEELEEIKGQCDQANKLADMYRQQVISLEEQVSIFKEETDMTKSIFQSKAENIQSKLKLMTQRYNELEKRRNLEIEGYQNDIKNLKSKLRGIERELYKVTIGFNENSVEIPSEKIDLQILRNVMNSTARSKDLMKNVKQMKEKIYQVEKSVRNL